MSPFVGRVLLYVVDGPAKPVVPSLSSKMNIPMFRPLSAFAFVLAIGLSASACDSDDPTGPTEEAPVAVTETFSGTVTLNGAVRHEFVTQRAGTVTATFGTLSPDSTAVLSVSLGTWNGQSCQAIISRDDMTSGGSVVGTASAGNFCVRVSDPNGRVAQPISYEVNVTHF